MNRIPTLPQLRNRLPLSALLVTGLVALLAGCQSQQSQESMHTVADYLHDQDAAKTAMKFYANDPGKYQGNPNWTNASSAASKIQFLNDCWPKKQVDRFTTANTDHACLDAHGYKR